MARRSQQNQTPSLIDRVNQAARYVITGIKGDTWMSPLQPLQVYLPAVDGRRYDYQVGRNLNYTPRGNERSFAELRRMAMNCELVRLAIETRKDQMDALTWAIKPKVDTASKGGNAKDGAVVVTADQKGRIKELTQFFENPDRTTDWSVWQRSILEEVFVTDAATVFRRRTRGGKLYSLEQIDGSTIFPLIDQDGRTPLPPDPAFQQILKGVPKVDYSTENLIYAPKNVRVYTPYGFSQTEQVIRSAFTSIERMKLQLAYFTAGSTPDTYAVAPADLTPDQIKGFEDNLNGLLSGNLQDRRKIMMFPYGTKMEQLKPPPLKDEFDEWLARIVCFAFSLPPTAFVKQMNRATAGTQQETATEEGLEPLKLWIARLVNRVIREDYGYNDLEFAWNTEKEQDLKESADIDVELVKAGIQTINEVRSARGLPPVPGGDVAMLATATGYVAIDAPPPEPQPGPNDPDAEPEQQNDNGSASESNKVPKQKTKPVSDAAAKAAGLKKKPTDWYASHPSH